MLFSQLRVFLQDAVFLTNSQGVTLAPPVAFGGALVPQPTATDAGDDVSSVRKQLEAAGAVAKPLLGVSVEHTSDDTVTVRSAHSPATLTFSPMTPVLLLVSCPVTANSVSGGAVVCLCLCLCARTDA